RRGVAFGLQEVVTAVEAHLCGPRAREDLRRDVRLELGDPLRDARRVLVVPGGLDEQPAGVCVAGFRDVPAVALLAGGVLARGQAEEAHQLARRAETPEVTDLGREPERRQRLDAAEAAEPRAGVRP